MKIFHVIKSFGVSGITRMVTDLAICQKISGHSVTVFCLEIEKEADRLFAERTKKRLSDHQITARIPQRLPPASYFSMLWQIFSEMKNENVIIHSHEAKTDLLCALAARGRSRKFIRTLHNTSLWGDLKFFPWLTENLANGYSYPVACSHDVAISFEELLADNNISPKSTINIIENGLPLPSFTSTDLKVERRPRLAFFGRSDVQKGLDVLLLILNEFESDPGFSVDIYLSGGTDEEYRKFLNNKTFVNVFPSHPNAREIMQNYEAILMPSRYEGLPLLALEAMACGIPVIVHNAPGLKNVMPNKWKYNADIGDISGFKKAITQLLSDIKDEEIRQKISKGLTEHSKKYDIKNTCSKYDLMYQKTKEK